MAGKGKAPESEAFIADGGPKVPQKKGFSAFTSFLYNKDDGTFLGRTPLSWLEITVFYIIFYAALVGFWAACLVIFLQTIDYKVPCWYGHGTIIGDNPGMGYMPWQEDQPESTLIHINTSKPESYKSYVDRLDKWFKKYEKVEGTRKCGKGESNKGLEDNELPCQVDVTSMLKEGTVDCTKATSYGYAVGKPCVVITLNRLIGWAPEPYESGEVPPEVQGRYHPEEGVPIDCEGEAEADKENIGSINYVPRYGFDVKYFPYRVAENYQQPFAVAQFENIRKGILVEVVCRAYAANIQYDAHHKLGMVHFEVLVDS